MKKVYLLFFILIAVCVSNLVNAQIRYVKQDATGDGSSWANASGNLQAMIDELAALPTPGGEVWVAEGAYKPEVAFPGTTTSSTAIGARDRAFILRKDVKVYGGFDINASIATTFAQRDVLLNPTILSGDINNDNTLLGNSYHVVLSVGDVGTAILDGFTVTGGSANILNATTLNGISMQRAYGAGMHITGSSPIISNIIVEGNEVRNGSGNVFGGGIYLANSSAKLTNVTVSNNTVAYTNVATGPTPAPGTAGSFGGGIYVTNNTPNNVLFTNTVIQNNNVSTSSLSDASSARGGGIYVTGTGSITIEGNLIITGNKAFRVGTSAALNVDGGGAYINNIIINMSNVLDAEISDNECYRRGGGMNITGTTSSTSILSKLRFNDNSTETGAGGALYIDETSPDINNSSFAGNSAGTSGGAIYINRLNDGSAANPSFENVTFLNNTSATSGGALYVFNGQSISILNSKFISNTAGTSGGAIFLFGQANPNVILNPIITNSVFYNNKAETTAASNAGGGAIFISQNVNALTVTNSTFYGNLATSTNKGGAIHAAYNSSNLRLYNSILWGNTPSGLGEDLYFGGTSETAIVVKNSITQSYNTEITEDLNKIGVNPLFASITFADGNFLHLTQSSPAINAGDNSYITGITTDLTGAPNSRIIHDIVDMGAYEYQGTLPVELISFKANIQNNNAVLNWSVASEDNNDYYILEKSADGKVFTLLSNVPSKGNTNSRLDYSLTDFNPSSGTNYYRLSQKDKNGTSKELAIDYLNFRLEAESASVIYPNPTRTEFSIKVSAIETNNILVSISNIEGKLIFRENLPVSNGIATVKLNDNIKPGNYIVSLQSDNVSERKIISIIP